MYQKEDNIDENDLMDYIKVILKRKKMIFGITVLAVIAAAGFSFYMPKVYDISTSLEIGVIDKEGEGDFELIEEPGQIVAKIESDVYGVLVREKLQISEEDYPEIKTENPKNTNLVVTKIESDKTEQSKNILEKINNLILGEHQVVVENKKQLIEKEISTTEDKIQLSQSDIEKTKNKISPTDKDIQRIKNKILYCQEEVKNLENKVKTLEKVLVYEQTPGTQFALFDAKEKLAKKRQEIENLYLNINNLERTKQDLWMQINSLQVDIKNFNTEIELLKSSLNDIKPTKIVKVPTVSEEPVKPRTLLNIVIAGVLGLFMGTFLAFFREFWEKSNKLA